MRSAWSNWFSLAQYRKDEQLDHFSSLVQRNGKRSGNKIGDIWADTSNMWKTLIIQGVAPVSLYIYFLTKILTINILPLLRLIFILRVVFI